MPLAEDLEKLVLRLVRLNSTMSPDQKEYFKSRGYTFLSPTQMDIMEGRKRTRSFVFLHQNLLFVIFLRTFIRSETRCPLRFRISRNSEGNGRRHGTLHRGGVKAKPSKRNRFTCVWKTKKNAEWFSYYTTNWKGSIVSLDLL